MASQPKDEETGAPSRVVRGVTKELGGFRKFLVRGNVVDLAVGIVIGAAFTSVVQAIVDNMITPLIGLAGGGPDLSNLNVGVVQFGPILNAAISFIIVAAVVYFLVVLPVNKLMDRYRPEPKPAPTKDCPECLSAIPETARRCRECGAQLAPPSEEVVAAMRQVAAPTGAQIADEAAQVLRERLAGER